MKSAPEIKLKGVPKELEKSFAVIGRLIRINDLDIDYKFTIDFNLDSYGIHDPSKKMEIRVNPYLFKNASLEEKHAPFYTTDFSLFAVCIHEFSHLLDTHFGIVGAYRQEFPEKIILNMNSLSDRQEELAEVMTLFITNPFFLRAINKSAYLFLRTYFRSPTACTSVNFLSRYKKWDKEIRKDFRKKWKLVVRSGEVISLS